MKHVQHNYPETKMAVLSAIVFGCYRKSDRADLSGRIVLK